MAIQKTTKRRYDATLGDGEQGETVVVLRTYEDTTVKDGAGRTRWGHEDMGRGPSTELARLSIKEAGALLESLVSALVFVATESAD
jgi:hypothetical protein